MAKKSNDQEIARALAATLISVNELDSNEEAANVVDGLFAIARAIDRLAKVLEKQGESAEAISKE